MRWQGVLMGLLGFVGSACTAEPAPLASRFDTVFVRGQICIPASVNTTSQTHFPVRFAYELPSCVSLEPEGIEARLVLVGNELVLLGTGEFRSEQHEFSTCDEADLNGPTRGSDHKVWQDFQVPIPLHEDGTPAFGRIAVTVPYYSVDEGQVVVDRLNAGDDPVDVVGNVVNGAQSDRVLYVTLGGGDASVEDADDFEDDDCHEIAVGGHR